MNLDLFTLSGVLILLILNTGLMIWLGSTQTTRIPVRIDAHEAERLATERMLRRNLGLPDSY